MNRRSAPDIIAIDGHDASGKSTISALVARDQGGVVARAFPDALGGMIAWLAERGEFARANELAHLGVKKAVSDNFGARLLVFDRHWLTIFTLLPEAFWQSWLPRPRTVLCWTNSIVTKQRLEARGEVTADVASYDRSIAQFRRIAEALDVPLVDTSYSSPEAAATAVMNKL